MCIASSGGGFPKFSNSGPKRSEILRQIIEFERKCTIKGYQYCLLLNSANRIVVPLVDEATDLCSKEDACDIQAPNENMQKISKYEKKYLKALSFFSLEITQMRICSNGKRQFNSIP